MISVYFDVLPHRKELTMFFRLEPMIRNEYLRKLVVILSYCALMDDEFPQIFYY